MEAKQRNIRCLKVTGDNDNSLLKSFVYINCPNCNKRLIQAKVTTRKMKAYTVDKAHPAETAELTIKCERCKSIVAIAK